MDILSYLTTLIKTHKEVGIPGLGTIYKRKSPGRYDTETHSFLPPGYSLSFTSDLKEQVLLTDMISKKKDISADAATYFVEQFSQNVLDELSNQQESDFGDLGTFSTTSGSLIFIPKQAQDFGFDFYGLPVLKDQVAPQKETADEFIVVQKDPAAEELPLIREQLDLENNNADLGDGSEIYDNAELHDNAEPDEEPVYEEIAEATYPLEEPKLKSGTDIETAEILNEEEKKPGMSVYLKVIIAFVAVLTIAAIAYVVKPELFNTAIKNIEKPDTVQRIKKQEQLKIDSIARADSVRKSNEKAILAIDSAKDSTALKSATPLVLSYDIIAASLLNKKEADKFLASMEKRGIPAKIADMPGRRIKISIGSFTDEDAAKKELEILKKTTKIPGIYVIPIRHTNNPK